MSSTGFSQRSSITFALNLMNHGRQPFAMREVARESGGGIPSGRLQHETAEGRGGFAAERQRGVQTLAGEQTLFGGIDPLAGTQEARAALGGDGERGEQAAFFVRCDGHGVEEGGQTGCGFEITGGEGFGERGVEEAGAGAVGFFEALEPVRPGVGRAGSVGAVFERE